jgi:hypothetical protein
VRRERQRHPRPDRLRRRPTDRIEDLVIWALITFGLLTAAFAVAVAAHRYEAGMQRVAVEARERTLVQAVLAEPTRQLFVTDDQSRVVRQVPMLVPVRYTAPDGTARAAEAPVTGRYPAGASVRVWVDRAGAIAAEPIRPVDAVTSAAAGGLGLLIVGALAIGCIWVVIHHGILRINAARWAREWEQVEPMWSGRST